jgi:autotransporter-associated beta strand protein
MKNIARTFLLAAAATVSLSAQSLIQGPSSSQSSYLTPTAPGWSATAIMTVGDRVGGLPAGYMFAGIPDGLGAYSNGDGTMTVLANHEIGATQTTPPVLLGTARAHGAAGGFVSKWVINTSTWQVISGGDFVTSPTNQMMWDTTANSGAGNWVALTASNPYAYLRPCSADLPKLEAFYDASNGGTGYNGLIFLNGEETGAEGKGLAWIVTGTEAGKVYELPHHGKYSWENALARSNYGLSPSATNLLQTVVVGTDDTTPGEVYVYIGTKNNTGNAVQKAGLANGITYGIKASSSVGYSGAIALENATGINGTFSLEPIFATTLANKTGAQFQTESTRLGITQFARPEDAHWVDTDTLIFATTGASGSAMAGATVTSKIYQLDFNSSDAAGILTTGGNIKVVVDSDKITGLDGQKARSFDNLTIGDDGKLYIQEDPGSNAYVAKHWIVDHTLSTQALREASAVQIFESDRSRFTTGAVNFQTIDEEHSGIIDISTIVNDGTQWFLVATQNHAAATGANAATLVEGGQFIALNKRAGSDVRTGPSSVTLTNGGSIVVNGLNITDAVTLTGTGGVFDITGSSTASGAIGGTGGLWKNGTGTLTLTGANSYTGDTIVAKGKLVINGSVTSSVRILKGNSFGGTVVVNGNLTNLGTLAPGNSPGTTTISGNYIEAGTLDIEVWGTTANTQHDQVVVSGTATFQAGSTLMVTRTGSTFDLSRTQSVLAVSALAYSGAFTTLDRGTQTTQVFFNNATGRIHGSGLTETQTFADLTVDTNRKAIATVLYAVGLTDAAVIKNVTIVATAATGTKAFIASGEMGAATVAFLGAANVDTALDALSPEVYGTSLLMASRNTYSLARSLAGAQAFGDTWNAQLGYDQQQSTSTASTTSLNGSFDVNSTYALLSRKVGPSSVFSVLIAENNGKSSASGFASEASGQSYGLGFGTETDLGRLDFGLVNGELTSSGSRSGQTFSNQKINSTTLSARMSFTKLGAFVPYAALSRNIAESDGFTEVGTGANLNVAAAKQADVTAEVGMGYGIKVGENLTVSLNVAYEHALSTDGGTLNASFADAAVPTTFTVRTFGAGQDILRGGLGVNIGLGEGRSAAVSYDYHTGVDVKSAHQIKASYSFRF